MKHFQCVGLRPEGEEANSVWAAALRGAAANRQWMSLSAGLGMQQSNMSHPYSFFFFFTTSSVVVQHHEGIVYM